MKVARVGGGGRVLVADEGGECAGVVVVLGGLDDALPGGTVRFAAIDLVELAAPEGLQPPPETLGGSQLAQLPGDRHVVQRVLRVVHRRQHAKQDAVVGHRLEVQGPPELHRVAGGVNERRAAREAVGVVRRRPHVEDVGVHREAGVDVQVAEVRVAQGIRLRCARRVRRVRPGAGVLGRPSAAGEQARDDDREGGKTCPSHAVLSRT